MLKKTRWILLTALILGGSSCGSPKSELAAPETPVHPTVGDAAAAVHPVPALRVSMEVFDLPSPFERPTN